MAQCRADAHHRSRDTHRVALRHGLTLALCALMLAACGGDEALHITREGERYAGALLALDVDGSDLIPAGTASDSNDPTYRGAQTLALPGVDPARVVLIENSSSEGPDFVTFRAVSLGSGNIFGLVPELCQYAPAESEEC